MIAPRRKIPQAKPTSTVRTLAAMFLPEPTDPADRMSPVKSLVLTGWIVVAIGWYLWVLFG